MSGDNGRISNFVHDLVTMAKATERLPELEAEVKRYEAQQVEDGNRIARLELKLREADQANANLLAKLRSVEVERDDASFRELEALDRATDLRRVARDCTIALGEALKVLEPAVTEPTAAGSGQANEGFGESQPVQTSSLPAPEDVPGSTDTGEARPLSELSGVGTESASGNTLSQSTAPTESGELQGQREAPKHEGSSATDHPSVSLSSASAAPNLEPVSTPATSEAQEVAPKPDPIVQSPPGSPSPTASRPVEDEVAASTEHDWTVGFSRISHAS